MDAEVDRARSDAVAWCAVASERSGATVLGADCDWDDEPESGRSGRRVAGGRQSLVPASWWHAIVYVETCIPKIFIVRGARRNWTAASPRRWCTGDRAPHWAKLFYGLTRADTQRCNSWRQARIIPAYRNFARFAWQVRLQLLSEPRDPTLHRLVRTRSAPDIFLA